MNLDNNQALALEEIKKRTVSALSNIIAEVDNNDPQHKFDLAMTALKYDSSAELANVALESAMAISDPQIKSDMLMQILAEISYIEDTLKR